MDVFKLKQLQYLKKEIEQIQNRIIGLRESAEKVTSGGITDEPFGGGRSDKVGNGVASIVDLVNLLESRKRGIIEEEYRLSKWIGDIVDSDIRQIMTYRYINNYSFQKIALAMGHYDEQYPRHKHNKYLKCTKNTN